MDSNNFHKDCFKILHSLEVIEKDYIQAIDNIENQALSTEEMFRSANNLAFWERIKSDLFLIKEAIFVKIEKSLFEIKIEVKKEENPKLLNFLEKYNVVQDLFIKGEYEKALIK